jgi:hypothetical protein
MPNRGLSLAALVLALTSRNLINLSSGDGFTADAFRRTIYEYRWCVANFSTSPVC